MPKRTDIRSVLISSAGLIVIAQERPDVPLLITLSATTRLWPRSARWPIRLT